MEYYFKILTNIKVETAYLHKRDDTASALYRKGTLVGAMLPIGTTLDLAEYLTHLLEIFPEQQREFDLYHCFNPTVSYHWNESKTSTQTPIAPELINIEPIITYLPKANGFVAALYWHQHLVGVCQVPTLPEAKMKPINLQYFAPYLYEVFPKDINELDSFVQQHPTIEYYYNDELIII